MLWLYRRGRQLLQRSHLLKRCLLLLSKLPGASPIKTRLAATEGQAFAETLYRCFLADIAQKSQAVPADLWVGYAPAEAEPDVLQQIFGEAYYFPQQGADLGERMYAAFAQAFAAGYTQALLMGGDCPDLPPTWLMAAFDALNDHDISLLPSLDGGYCAIGFAQPSFGPELFNMPAWSSPDVYQQSLQRAAAVGKQVWSSPARWQDVDTADDLADLLQRQQGPLQPELSWFQQSQTLNYLRMTNWSAKPAAPKDEHPDGTPSPD